MKNRDQQRTRVLLGGKIIFNDNRGGLECVIKDISAGGTRITTENFMAVPDSFKLLVSDGRSFSCEVRWRKAKFIGVAFVDQAS